MSRIVSNKHIEGDNVTVDDFYEGINIENPDERKNIAMGRIILNNKEGFESIWILNDNDVPKLVGGQSASYISECVESAKAYTDSAITIASSVMFDVISGTYATIENVENLNTIVSGQSEDLANIRTIVDLIEPKANNALQSFSLGTVKSATSVQTGAKAFYANGSMAVLDLTNLEIDGGFYNLLPEHEYVDLGLPSGTLWATENIKDANGNELYFAWGETQGYTSGQVGTDKNFTWEGEENDYAFGPMDWDDDTNYGMSKYNNTDGKTVLDATDDAATSNWGSSWKMPTKTQFEELTANTTTAWTQVDGVNGLLCTSTANTNTLFFPAVGSAEYGGFSGVGGGSDYWSVSLDDNNVSRAWELLFGDGICEVSNGRRYRGYSVRPVRINS